VTEKKLESGPFLGRSVLLEEDCQKKKGGVNPQTGGGYKRRGKSRKKKRRISSKKGKTGSSRKKSRAAQEPGRHRKKSRFNKGFKERREKRRIFRGGRCPQERRGGGGNVLTQSVGGKETISSGGRELQDHPGTKHFLSQPRKREKQGGFKKGRAGEDLPKDPLKNSRGKKNITSYGEKRQVHPKRPDARRPPGEKKKSH